MSDRSQPAQKLERLQYKNARSADAALDEIVAAWWKTAMLLEPARSRRARRVDKQFPADWIEKLPVVRAVVEEKSFIVIENVQGHQTEHEEQDMLRGEATFGTRRLNRGNHENGTRNRGALGTPKYTIQRLQSRNHDTANGASCLSFVLLV